MEVNHAQRNMDGNDWLASWVGRGNDGRVGGVLQCYLEARPAEAGMIMWLDGLKITMVKKEPWRIHQRRMTIKR
jgi:hypothetical protein